MIHIILLIAGAWYLTRLLARIFFKRDQAASRIVLTDPEVHARAIAWHRHQHETFAARHTVDWNPPRNPIADARETHRCARFARDHGYGSNAEVDAAYAELRVLQGDLLAPYRPAQDETLRTIKQQEKAK